MNPPAHWRRRAQPLLGTLVEVGVPAAAPASAQAQTLALAAVATVQAELSRFEADSDLARLARLPPGTPLALRPAAQRVFRAAQALRDASQGAFDITLGSGCFDWSVQAGRLQRGHAGVRFDLGGIAKGHALDAAVQALRQAGCSAGWVNAGGDLRVFGELALPLRLRDEQQGGVRELGHISDGAVATSRFGPGSRNALFGTLDGHAAPAAAFTATPGGRRAGAADAVRHVTVAAPRGLWADALTKLVALAGSARHPRVAPLLARLGAQAWVHGSGHADMAHASPAHHA